MAKKKIIIYSSNDKLITFPILERIFTTVLKNENVDLFLNKPKFTHKLKVLIVFLLFSSLKDFKLLFKNKSSGNMEKFSNVNIINKIKNNYDLGFSINYTNKIKLKKYKIYNFHLGNYEKQRGSFGYFFKFKYNWKSMDLTFHLIDKNWDRGKIINKKKLDINEKSSVEICTLYKFNTKFIEKNIDTVLKNKINFLPTKYGKLNTTPTYKDILKVYLKRINIL